MFLGATLFNKAIRDSDIILTVKYKAQMEKSMLRVSHVTSRPCIASHGRVGPILGAIELNFVCRIAI